MFLMSPTENSRCSSRACSLKKRAFGLQVFTVTALVAFTIFETADSVSLTVAQ